MENTEDLVYIGKLKNGKEVYDTKDSRWQSAHKIVTPELLQEALGKIEIDDGQDLFVDSIDMGRVIGKTYCVQTTELDQVFKARRNGRVGETPTVINKAPADCSKLAIVLNKNDNKSYILATTYIGEITPMEPWDQALLELGDQQKIQESKEFWSNHALVYDRTAIDYFVLDDGSKMTKQEFETKYVHNVNKHKFDAPKDSLLMLMGVPGSGKTTRAKGFLEQLKSVGIEAQMISSDDIRKDIFGEENVNSNSSNIYTSESKKIVYDTMIKKAGENLEQGLFTIVDATFLFENGESARRELCKLAQDNNRPIRAIIVKVQAEQAKAQNQMRTNPVDEKAIDEMSSYANNRYSEIKQELMAMPNTKVEIVGELRNKVAPTSPTDPGVPGESDEYLKE